MEYTVKTAEETLHSITYNYYGNLAMLNKVLLANENLEDTFLAIGTIVKLPTQEAYTVTREKLY
ncbi:Phage Tail Protein X [Candidatus Hepatincola sp. Pdp]